MEVVYWFFIILPILLFSAGVVAVYLYKYYERIPTISKKRKKKRRRRTKLDWDDSADW